jgi:hypothetical protein
MRLLLTLAVCALSLSAQDVFKPTIRGLDRTNAATSNKNGSFLSGDTSVVLTHNLGTTNIDSAMVQCRTGSTTQTPLSVTNLSNITTTQLTVNFSAAPADGRCAINLSGMNGAGGAAGANGLNGTNGLDAGQCAITMTGTQQVVTQGTGCVSPGTHGLTTATGLECIDSSNNSSAVPFTISGTTVTIAGFTGTCWVKGTVAPSASVNAQTGTSYTLQAADNGRVVTLSNASAITLTVPTGLGVGFNVMVVQLGAGQVTPTASGTTLLQRSGYTKTGGQYAVLTLVSYAADTLVMSGDMQ